MSNWTWMAAAEPGQTNITVPLLAADTGFYRLAHPTNDSDFDGLTDYWSWLHFGHALGWALDNSRADDDYDGDGVCNAGEFANETDPNTLSFRAHLGLGYAGTTNPAATITVLGGVPAELALLVNSTNFATPDWQPYTAAPLVSLPDAEGEHLVWVTLRGRTTNTVPKWAGFGVTLDRVAPTLVLTSPTTNVTSKPVIQLTGYSVDTLASVSCMVSNTLGWHTNWFSGVTRRSFGAAETNHFQCFDVALAPGLNALTVQATDRAGNVGAASTNLAFDVTGDTSAPVLTVLWPADGARLGTDSFTLRGQVDDETAIVQAALVNSGGETNVYAGRVVRDGALWVENVVLAPGTNWLTVTVTDAATNSFTTNLTLVRSEVTVTIAEPGNVSGPTTTVSGTVTESSGAVWVNGVAASVDGEYWTATDVPVTPGGTAVFVVSVIPDGGNTTPGTSEDPSQNNPSDPDANLAVIEPEKPAEVELVHGEWERHFLSIEGYEGVNNSVDHIWSWDQERGGHAAMTWVQWSGESSVSAGAQYWQEPDGTERFESWMGSPDNVFSTGPVNVENWFWPGFNLRGPAATGVWGQRQPNGYGGFETETWVGRNMANELRTHGNEQSSLIQITATAFAKDDVGWVQQPYDQTTVNNFGVLQYPGTIVREKPDRATLDVTTTSSGGLVTADPAAQAARLKLKSVTFTGPTDEYYSIKQDTNGVEYPGPHWTPTNSYPALYVSGSKVRTALDFAVQRERFEEPFILRGIAKTSGQEMFQFWATSSIPANVSGFNLEVAADTALASNKVDFLNSLSIEWTYALTNDMVFRPLKTSENQVYVTWHEPQSYAILRHTVVDLACKNSGATSADGVVANTWMNFAGPANVTTVDGKALFYYKEGLPAASAARVLNTLLESTNMNSQCDGMEELFRQALHVNGIAIGTGFRTCAKYTINAPAGEDFMLIKSWTFGAANTNEPTHQWSLDVGKDATGGPEMVPETYLSGTVSNEIGIAGQNSPTPAEKIFGRHYLVRYTDSTGTDTLLDPSYGRTYTNNADFISQSVAGYGVIGPEQTNSTILRLKVRQP